MNVRRDLAVLAPGAALDLGAGLGLVLGLGLDHVDEVVEAGQTDGGRCRQGLLAPLTPSETRRSTVAASSVSSFVTDSRIAIALAVII